MSNPAQPPAPARRNCGALVEHRRLLNEDPAYVSARASIETAARSFAARGAAARPGITEIPLVVHVVWNTESQNISDEQIQSQLDVLNADFRGTNSDIDQVPDVWKPIIGDSRVTFVLATTDPDGNPTNGVLRIETDETGFGMDGNPVKFAASGGSDAWPSEEYLNVWVCQLGAGLLGYAQFPGGPPETDGVVILHSAFGTTGTVAAPFDLGRTTTHEIGHWLNLFHIWGDDGSGCGGTDEVDDTPNAGGPNTGVPTFPSISCDNEPDGDMFVNYMDYTDDIAMFMFTAGQVTRMEATLDGPRSTIGTEVPAAARKAAKKATKKTAKTAAKKTAKKTAKKATKKTAKKTATRS
jgi:hypothetical protein